MKELALEEIKLRELNLLKELKIVCETNALRYFLAAGTLLGAIRHKGFIPWDDDIDIVMPRPDYNKLIEIYRHKSSGNNLLCRELYPKYKYMFAKLSDIDTIVQENNIDCKVELGVYVDIFPIDGMGDTEEEAKALLRKNMLNIYLSWFNRNIKYKRASSFKKNFIKFPLYILSKILGDKGLYKRIDKLSKTYEFDSCKFVGHFNDTWLDNRIMPHSIYESAIAVDFEDEKFPAPVGYDYYLTKFYGDYMTPPPIEKRVLAHGFVATLKDSKR